MEENFDCNKSGTQQCPVTTAINIIGGKWKTIILWLISNDITRFGEMYRSLPGITKKMLTVQLRELEADGLINRKVFPVVPPKVEYSFTATGESLRPIIEMLKNWGLEHGAEVLERRKNTQLATEAA